MRRENRCLDTPNPRGCQKFFPRIRAMTAMPFAAVEPRDEQAARGVPGVFRRADPARYH